MVRRLEAGVVMVVPQTLTMESHTLLTQYVIRNWTLGYVNQTDASLGIMVELVLRRRIMNAVLTIYLPTILVLCIVYATNYFKDFFFEAVVTVNLTSLLVLTTLFISVSDSLPKTAYVKMVDIWLIFAQLVPWLEVLLHTAMDLMRTEDKEGEEEEAREVNHHGKIITVGGKKENSVLPKTDVTSKQLIQVDEGKMVAARRDFYDNAKKFNKNNYIMKHLKCSGSQAFTQFT